MGLQREEKSEGKGAQTVQTCGHREGSRHGCPRRLGSPGPSFGQNKFLYKISHAHSCSHSAGRQRLQAASALSREPRTEKRREAAISCPQCVRGPRRAAGAAWGRGTRWGARSTPRADSSHTVGFVSAPCPLAPGKLRRSPRKGEGRGRERQGSADPQPRASQRAAEGQPARRGASQAIAERGPRSGTRGSAGSRWGARRHQAEVTGRRGPAAWSPPCTGCSMGSGAAGAGGGCSAAET